MYLIKSIGFVESFYSFEELYEDVIYSDKEKVMKRINEIAEEENALVLGEYKGYYTIVLRSCFLEEETDPELLEDDGCFFLFPMKMDVI